MRKSLFPIRRLLVQTGSLLLLFMSSFLHATSFPPSKQPLLFIENKGQVSDSEGHALRDIHFTAGNSSVKLFLGSDRIYYRFLKDETNKDVKGALSKVTLFRLDMELVGANANPRIRQEGETEYTENYYGALYPEGITGARSFTKIIYENVYPNIDWVLYSNADGLKYDFIVHPGGNPKDIRLQYSGAESMHLEPDGSVKVRTPLGEVIEKTPLVFQGEQVIGSQYRVQNNTISFSISDYDKTLPLIIDPVISWGNYFGGAEVDEVRSVVADRNNNIYAAGITASSAGISFNGGHQASFQGIYDGFLVKYSANGIRQWATYYGGTEQDEINEVKVDGSGNLYVVGTTQSSSGIAGGSLVYQSTISTFGSSSQNAFVAKFNANGIRQWGTYYGGSGGGTTGNSIEVDFNGNVFIGGSTNATSGISTIGNFNVEGSKTFVAHFSTSGVRQWGNIGFISSNSSLFEQTGVAVYGQYVYSVAKKEGFGYLFQYSQANGALLWSRTIGSSVGTTAANKVATDASGFVYVVGRSSNSGLGTSGTHQQVLNGTTNAFLRKYTNTGDLVWGTYIGSGQNDDGTAISITGFDIYVAGRSGGLGFATTNTHKTSPNGTDAYVNKFNSSGIRQWGTYYGGNGGEEALSVFARPDYVIIGGRTSNSFTGISYNGSTVPGGGSSFDGFVARFAATCPAVPQAGAIAGNATVCQGSSQVYSVTPVANATTYQWSVPTGSTITAGQGTNSITVTMGSTSQNIIVTAKNSCDAGIAQSKALTINPLPFTPGLITGSTTVNTSTTNTYTVSNVSGVTYNWSASGGGIVTGSGNSVSISWSTGGTKTVSVTATNTCGTSAARTLAVNVNSCTAPAQPSVISKSSGLECIGSSAIYSVTNVAGVSYTWAVSTGGTIVGSGSSATVTWNASTGTRTITVTPSNACGNGVARTLDVSVLGTPLQPSVITGNATVCTGVSTAYTVTNIPGVTYTWNTGGAGTITGSGNSINVTWTSAGAKTLTVTPSTACGSGASRTLAVSVGATPSQPSVIAGANAVQTGTISQYSITPEPGVTYAWSSSPAGTITGSGSSVNISWPSAGAKTITVTPSNACGAGTARTLAVTVSDCALPAQSSTVGGSTTACVGLGSIYLVTNVGGVSYNWDPGVDGAVVGSGNSVTLTWSTNGTKTITVTPFNACGNGPVRTFNVTVSGAPAQPSVIAGSTTACKDAATIYSVTSVPGVIYTWDTGGKGTVSGSGNSVSVTWTNTGTNTLVVTPSNSCGTGATRTLSVTVNRVPDPVSEITSNFSGCVNAAIPFSVTNVSGVTYTWNGGAGSTPSNTTNSPTVTWTTAGSKTLTVTPSNSCGNGIASSKNITISPLPSVAGVITGSASATEGVAQTYSVANVAGTTYTWSGGTGATIIGVGNSVQISWSSIGSKTVSVTPSNACGSATASTLGVTVGSAPCTPLGAPANVTGSTTFSTGSTAAFTAATVSGAVSYTFTVSPSMGTSIVNTGNANEKNITFANAGTYVVSAAAVNACGGTSPPVTLTVQVCNFPVPQPTGLVSEGAACIGKKQRYSVTVVPGFTYQWFATNGVVTNVSNGIVDVTWNNTSFGQVSVQSVNTCGATSTLIYGPSESLIGNPSNVTITSNLVGAFCDGKVVTWTISNPEAGVTYEWVSDRPATPTPTTITATISGPTDIKLFGTNACATNVSLSNILGTPFPVPTTAPGLITGPLNPITGQIVDYTIPNEGSPFGIRWNFGSGASDLPAGTTSMQAIFGIPGTKTLTAQYVSNPSCNVAGPARTLEVVAVNPCTVPSPPSAVTRLHSGVICKDVAYAFSVPNIAGVTYNWSAGADATITGTGNEVLIKWSTNGTKTIIASYTNACGTSATQQTEIGITPPPSSLPITGDNVVCNGTISNFSVANVGGISFIWEAPGATISGQGNNSITINNWPNSGVNVVKFKPSNACGFGPETTFNVTVNAVPEQPSDIIGDLELCSNTSKAFSVTNVPGVTYTWDAGANSTVTGTGNSRTIAWSTSGSKTIQVTPSNACGAGPVRLLNPNVISIPAQPSVIAGTSNVAIGTAVPYSVTNVNGVSYTWSLSDKGVLASSGNGSSVFWNTAGTATLSVTPSNACGSGTVRNQSITINKIAQTITFTLPSPALTTDEILFNGESNVGLPISYSSSNTSIAEINGGQLIIKGNGTINITASQTGDDTFAAAANVVRALTINKTSQSITFNALSPVAFGDEDIVLKGESNSGLSVSYSSSNTNVATVLGNTLTIVGAGTANITAAQGGNAIYNAATSVVRALTVNKADQTIAFEPLEAKGITDPPFPLSAASTSGLNVGYVSSNTAVATVSGSTVTIVGVGTTTITASQAGNTNYNAASSVAQELVVNGKQSQTITFNALPIKTFGDANFNLTATASSSLNVSYTSSDVSVASISGTTVTIVGAGSAVITASQSGDDQFNAASVVTQILTVNKATQTITFNALPSVMLNTGSLELNATASSGLDISYSSSNENVATISGSTITFISSGETTITASQAGNQNYLDALSVNQLLVIINKQSQSITFAALAAKTFGDKAFDLTATSSSGLAITFVSSNTDVATVSGNKLTIVGAGEVNITASQSGNAEFDAAADVVQILTVNKANQTITFTLEAERGITAGNFNLSATTTSGLTISYASSNATVATISGSTVAVLAPGTTTITASQSGNGNYNAADDVEVSLTIIDDTPNRIIGLSGNMSFGDAILPETITRALTISNTGNSTLTIKAITYPIGFNGESGMSTIAAGGTKVISVSFKPTEAKDYSGSIIIDSDATSGTSAISVSGKGILITAIEDVQDEPLKAFPSPGTGVYTIEIKNLKSKQAGVIDELGRAAGMFDLIPAGADHYQLDITSVSEGIYFLRVQTQQSVQVIRVIKVN